MRINDGSPTATIAHEQHTANLIAYLTIAEARGAKDDATRALDEQIRTRLGLTVPEVSR